MTMENEAEVTLILQDGSFVTYNRGDVAPPDVRRGRKKIGEPE